MKGSHPYQTTRIADTDLVEIWQFVAQHNLRAADRLIDQFAECICDFGQRSAAWRSIDLERSFLRRFVVGNFVIYYSTMTDPITIVRVLHGARDFTQLI